MVDLISALAAKRIPFKLVGTEVRISCPFCVDRGETADTRFRCFINPEKNVGYCHNCDWGKGEYDAVGQVAAKLLLTVTAESAPVPLIEEIVPEPVHLPSDFWPLWKPDEDEDFQYVQKYVLSRGITHQQIYRHRIGFSLTGNMAFRVVFPVYLLKKLVGLVGRDYTNRQKPKYLNTKGVRAIYNLPMEPPASFMLSEGIVKCLALERALPTVASGSLLGHSLTSKQEVLLQDIPIIYLWPDPDSIGIKGFLEVADALRENHTVYMPWPAPTIQADEMPAEDIYKMFSTMKPYDRAMCHRYLATIGRRLLY